jgi:hypothetical protein
MTTWEGAADSKNSGRTAQRLIRTIDPKQPSITIIPLATREPLNNSKEAIPNSPALISCVVSSSFVSKNIENIAFTTDAVKRRNTAAKTVHFPFLANSTLTIEPGSDGRVVGGAYGSPEGIFELRSKCGGGIPSRRDRMNIKRSSPKPQTIAQLHDGIPAVHHGFCVPSMGAIQKGFKSPVKRE